MATDTTRVPSPTRNLKTGTAARPRWRSALRWFGMPTFLVTVLGMIYVYVSAQELDSIEQRTLTAGELWQRVVEHVELAAVSTAIVIAVAVPLGIIATRHAARFVTPVILALGNLGQAIPSFGLITLVVLTMGVGFKSIIVGLFACSMLPILRNTMVGLQQVDQTLVKAARGMGMTGPGTLWRIELPLAVPVILAGVRTALILNIGTATLSTVFGVKALGYVIYQGIQLDRTPVLITGAVLASGLALLVDYLAGVAEELLTPRGL